MSNKRPQPALSLVHQFTVTAGTEEQLMHAMAILLPWHKSASHYRIGKDKDGGATLAILWYGTDGDVPFLTPVNDPHTLASHVQAWLNSIDYKTVRHSGHDGSDEEGWTAEGGHCGHVICTVTPAWVEYHK